MVDEVGAEVVVVDDVVDEVGAKVVVVDVVVDEVGAKVVVVDVVVVRGDPAPVELAGTVVEALLLDAAEDPGLAGE